MLACVVKSDLQIFLGSYGADVSCGRMPKTVLIDVTASYTHSVSQLSGVGYLYIQLRIKSLYVLPDASGEHKDWPRVGGRVGCLDSYRVVTRTVVVRRWNSSQKSR